MIKKIFYTFLAFLAILFYLPTNSYYDDELVFLGEGDNNAFYEGKTIKELKENIDYLDKENLELDDEFKTLNTDYELKRFLRDDLTILELNKIRNLVSVYNKSKSELEIELFQKAKNLEPINEEKKQLLEVKRNFYNGLIPYINTEYKDEYLEYIKYDAKIYNEQKDIASDIVAKKEILNNKVEVIENKIKEYNEFINENIRKIIEVKLEEKINNLKNNESFKVLNNNSKKKIIDKTIEKIKEKLERIKTTNDIITNSGTIVAKDTSVVDKKVQIYMIAIEKLEEFKNSIGKIK